MNRVKTNFIMLLFIFMFLFSFIFPAGAGDDDFKAWMNEQTQSFQTYKDERDGEFINFLKDQWKEFQVSEGIVRDTTPKPVALPVAPVFPQRKIAPLPKKILRPIKVPDKVPEPVPPKKPVIVTKPIVEVPQKGMKLDIIFYQTPVTIYVDPEFRIELDNTINKKSIAAFWDKLSRTDYDSFIPQTKKIKDQLKLNDWGYHQLLYETGMKIHKGSKNKARMFVWFMSTKAGYDSRLAYQNNRAYLLYPSVYKLFGTPYLTISGKRYYALTFNEKSDGFKSLFTYKGKYPKADSPLDYKIQASPALYTELKKRDLDFQYKGKTHSVSISFNKNLIEFFEFYPQTDMKVYFIAGISQQTEDSIVNELKPIIEGKSETEAIDMLLRFVQTSFKYKTDDNQFSRENYLLPEETLFYPYSDCEDRSFFFAYLVRRLTDLEVVGLGFPGHVAAAVRFHEDVPGDQVMVNGRKFAVCDPTYVNATSGMAMPKFKNVTPEIIFID